MSIETQETIGQWAQASFPPTDGSDGVMSQAVKLFHEAIELALACGASAAVLEEEFLEVTDLMTTAEFFASRPEPDKVAEEAADCHVVLNVLAHRKGFNLNAETARKMTKNLARRWSARPDGSAQHINTIDTEVA